MNEEVELEYDEAAQIVLELARSAALSIRQKDPELERERLRQAKAIEMIEDYCDSLL